MGGAAAGEAAPSLSDRLRAAVARPEGAHVAWAVRLLALLNPSYGASGVGPIDAFLALVLRQGFTHAKADHDDRKPAGSPPTRALVRDATRRMVAGQEPVRTLEVAVTVRESTLEYKVHLLDAVNELFSALLVANPFPEGDAPPNFVLEHCAPVSSERGPYTSSIWYKEGEAAARSRLGSHFEGQLRKYPVRYLALQLGYDEGTIQGTYPRTFHPVFARLLNFQGPWGHVSAYLFSPACATFEPTPFTNPPPPPASPHSPPPAPLFFWRRWT